MADLLVISLHARSTEGGHRHALKVKVQVLCFQYKSLLLLIYGRSCYVFSTFPNVLTSIHVLKSDEALHAMPCLLWGEADMKSDDWGSANPFLLVVYHCAVWIDGMWTEVLAVIIIVVANVICYAAHEKSLFHGHLRLPKIFFASNRWRDVQDSL